MPATVRNFLIINRAHAMTRNGNCGLMTGLVRVIRLGQVKPNILRMFDAQSFNDNESSFTKSLNFAKIRLKSSRYAVNMPATV